MRRAGVYSGLGAAVAALAIGAWYLHGRGGIPADVTVIAGGDAGRLARAEPVTEGFEAAGMQAAAQLAREQRAVALLVMRHEHLVLEQYGTGGDAEALVDGGGFGAVMAALAAGVAAARNGLPAPKEFDPDGQSQADADRLCAAIARASGVPYPQFLSTWVWRRLNAGPAYYLASTGALSARAGDWLRVAELLLQDGRFEGTQVVPPGWVRRIRLASVQSDVVLLRGPGGTRLWLAPRLQLAILRVGPAGGAVDETRLPALLVDAVHERPAASAPSLSDLVPGH